jgi:hypothetical protein
MGSSQYAYFIKVHFFQTKVLKVLFLNPLQDYKALLAFDSEELWTVTFPDNFFSLDPNIVSFLDQTPSVSKQKITIYNDAGETGIRGGSCNPSRVSIIRIFIRIFFWKNYSLLAKCYATLRVFMDFLFKKKFQKKVQKIFFMNFFSHFFLYFEIPVLIL